MSVELVIAERLHEELLSREIESVAGEGFKPFRCHHRDVVLMEVGEVPSSRVAHKLWIRVGMWTED